MRNYALIAVLPFLFTTPSIATDGVEGAVVIGCRLQAASPQSVGAPVKVRFTLTNDGEQDLRVLAWGTPFEGWMSKIFVIEKGGERARYEGPMFKRADPTPEEYLLLEAGGELDETIDLSQVYDLAAGTYRVSFAGVLHDVVAEGEAVPRGGDERLAFRVDCEAIELRLE
jgi:peptidyl-Lys metalloendopeptidase